MKSRVLTDQALAFSFTRRALMLGAAQLGAGGLLVGRMAWLSIAQNAKYDRLAESNRVQSQLIPPRRGWIVDRNGRPIAVNRTSFRVDLIPDRLQDPDRAIDELRQLLALSHDDVARIKEALDKAPGYQPVPVIENLDYERYAAVSVRQPDLPGVAPSSGFARSYPAGAAVGHLVGYVGPATAEQFQATRDPLLITPGFKVGKEGLEKSMEPWLRGKAGAKRTEVTAHGRLVAELTTRPEQMGHTLHLTIDAGLQEYAARRLGPNSGAVSVIDVATGGLLAFVSMPAYDPNTFSDGISPTEWAMLSGNDHLPLTNKVIQGLYPPGSTVKPMVALALLQWGVAADEIVHCSGVYRVGNAQFHCWRHSGHGPIDMRRAIQQSCDVYFYTMGRRIGIDKIAPMARDLGLGAKFDLPYAMQRYGTVPDSAWKLRRYKHPWTAADTVNAAIGQGYMLVNPLQLSVLAARIASGRALDPRLVLNRRYGPQGPSLNIPPSHLELVHLGMRDVVNTGGVGSGSASRLPLAGIEMAGKTGSAQVRRISMADRRAGRTASEALPWKYRDHGHFIGFAPVEEPRYAIAVTLEHGNHGGAAGQVARDVMTYLFAPDRAMATLATMESGWGGDIAQRMAADVARWQAGHLQTAADQAPAERSTGEPD
ncbi:penicillin-binding protein 2 [Sphingomonas nostoxanthinifaciens]|uniref:penicillin-binding protein 2 n=1 Tax=Sphingomonas nostoxanthinifaciens TaxID=2872652 RepID=UPI001CC21EA6|nr:penicillin-binding protein 2 [Sphingomonas nostoxanthinifaciens]UAK23708.1 penicillin-binding protein 2 [Sphingomonas nostoxanthinifaciens]